MPSASFRSLRLRSPNCHYPNIFRHCDELGGANPSDLVVAKTGNMDASWSRARKKSSRARWAISPEITARRNHLNQQVESGPPDGTWPRRLCDGAACAAREGPLIASAGLRGGTSSDRYQLGICRLQVEGTTSELDLPHEFGTACLSIDGTTWLFCQLRDHPGVASALPGCLAGYLSFVNSLSKTSGYHRSRDGCM